jgi:hypothetical protein
MILKFYKNLGCINTFNIKCFLVWWEEVKKVLHLTFLVIRGILCSHGSWHLTKRENNILCLSFHTIENINEGGQLLKMPLAFWSKVLKIFCTKLTLMSIWFQMSSHVDVFFTIWSLVKKRWTFKGYCIFFRWR